MVSKGLWQLVTWTFLYYLAEEVDLLEKAKVLLTSSARQVRTLHNTSAANG